MRLTIAYSKIKKRNLVLIYNATYQRETLSERPIRQTLMAPQLHTSLHDFTPNGNVCWGYSHIKTFTWMCRSKWIAFSQEIPQYGSHFLQKYI